MAECQYTFGLKIDTFMVKKSYIQNESETYPQIYSISSEKFYISTFNFKYITILSKIFKLLISLKVSISFFRITKIQ